MHFGILLRTVFQRWSFQISIAAWVILIKLFNGSIQYLQEHSKVVPGFSHNQFIPNPSLHQSFYHFTLYSLRHWHHQKIRPQKNTSNATNMFNKRILKYLLNVTSFNCVKNVNTPDHLCNVNQQNAHSFKFKVLIQFFMPSICCEYHVFSIRKTICTCSFIWCVFHAFM